MIVVWNVRGAASKAFSLALKELKRVHRPDVVVLIETRCSGPNAQKIIRRLGFQYQVIEEARGLSGGIWILWNSDNISITVIKQQSQFIHCLVKGLGQRTWCFTAVYGSPREAERKKMWEAIWKISSNTTIPWMLAGDFNDIKRADEQRGGAMVNEQRCRKFQENINKCNLIDLGSEGPKYTWRGPITHYANRLYKKLDRGLCNTAWRKEFSDASVRVGQRVQSDHHPLIISLCENQRPTRNCPFRFEAAWLKHQEFKNNLKQNWHVNEETWVELEKLKTHLSEWNHTVFGNIKKQKQELLRRLKGIQKVLQEENNPHLEGLEQRLQEELHEILDREEILWFQKARTQWLNDGDRNTSYYHTKTTVRRRKNRVNMLKNTQDVWVEGEKEVGELVNAFFKNLLSEED